MKRTNAWLDLSAAVAAAYEVVNVYAFNKEHGKYIYKGSAANSQDRC